MKTIEQIANEVIDGVWGNGVERKSRLKKAGYDYAKVQAIVNKIQGVTPKTIKELANEVLCGLWGDGIARKNKLESYGYDYTKVQAKVNTMLRSGIKTMEDLAVEVIDGKWGNGKERKKKLTKAGYNYEVVQSKVDAMLGGTNMPSAGNISNAYQWAIATCNRPDVGYSMAYRNQQVVNGITYYDCSSFIWYALKSAEFDVVGAYGGETWPFVTGTMGGVLLKLGFTSIPVGNEWLPGDILVRNNSYGEHTEMVYQGRRTMGAHSSRYPLPDQVSINTTDSDPATWDACYRYGGGASGDGWVWIQGGESEYFNKEQMKNNAACIWSYFYYKGWTLQAVAGLCGNIQQESTFNPNLIEIGGTGHGLVQWTPPSNLYDVLDAVYGSHEDWYLGDKQCRAIYAEYEQSTGIKDWRIEGQWYPTTQYPMSWKEWAESTQDPGWLAMAFEYNYERPLNHHPERAGYALEWYEYLKSVSPWLPPDDTLTPHTMPLWEMCRYYTIS